MSLPDAFQQWLREAFIGTGFSASHVRRLALHQLARWRAGDNTAAMPGYPAPPANKPYSDFPRGWGLKNFQRLSAQGRDAAKAVRLATSRR